MNQIINSVLEHKLIAIVRGVQREDLIPLAEALYNGGIRILEITFSANGSISDEDTATNIKLLADHFADRMHIGAGTVLKPSQVELTKKSGGSFIISPDTNADVITLTQKLDMVSIPGAFTPTEIQYAHRVGADFVKLFPAVNCGPEYFKAITAPLSHIRLLAVGGIDYNNIADYIKVGVCGFGIGSNIIDKKMLENKDYDGLTNLARKYVEAVK